MSEKIRLLILFGGISNEHEVSRLSTASILREIDQERYEITKVGITKEGRWYMTQASPEAVSDGSWEKEESNVPVTISLGTDTKGLLTYDGKEIPQDVVFPVMHGRNAEDGRMQGLLEIAGLPYVGPGVLASATGMDKMTGKIIAGDIGVRQADWYPIDTYQFVRNPLGEIDNIEKYFSGGYPLFIKPANSGSSVGITKAHDRKELFDGIKAAAEIDHRILVEEAITGREIEVAVLGNREPKASRIGEIFSANEMYDYEAKYHNSESRTRIIDDLPEETERQIRETAVEIYRAFDCRGLSRVDFFYTEDGELVFNEINTLPGFTSISMYPQLWNDMGVGYSELIDRLIDLAMEER